MVAIKSHNSSPGISTIERQFPLDLSRFCTSCEQRHSQPFVDFVYFFLTFLRHGILFVCLVGFVDFIGVTLVNKMMQVSGVQLDCLINNVSTVSADLWNKEQICLLSSQIKIMSPSRAKGRFASPHSKEFVFPEVEGPQL